MRIVAGRAGVIGVLALSAVIAAAAAACDTKNVGTTALPDRGPIVTVVVPAQMGHNLIATWTVTWVGGTAPFTISMDMGGGTTEDIPAGTPAVSPFIQDFRGVNLSTTGDATCTYLITVTDSLGRSGVASGQYTLGPVDFFAPPMIDSAVFDPVIDVLTVVVSDSDPGETLTVTVTEPPGLVVDATSKVASQTGPLTAVFYWSATDLIAGGSGETEVMVTDGCTWSTPIIVTIVVDGMGPVTEDQLAAVPTQNEATTAETVTVVVLVSVIPAAKPFQYMNGCGVTVETGATYAPYTFNVGVPGGSAGDTDGFWTNMDPAGGFLLPPDSFIQARDIGGGRHRIDFNLTPIGGHDIVGVSGALFNFGLDFAAPGTYTLGFEEFRGVDRTYYSDGESNVYYWDDISNNIPGIPNSIVVR